MRDRSPTLDSRTYIEPNIDETTTMPTSSLRCS
jgi:hypothetical protein